MVHKCVKIKPKPVVAEPKLRGNFGVVHKFVEKKPVGKI